MNWRPYLIGAAIPIIAGGLIGILILLSGVINVSADTPHSAPVYALLTTARERSIEQRLDEIEVPENLQQAERIRRGAGNYDAMCADCHLIPAQENSEIRAGLYPQPPNLATGESVGDTSRVEARQFWIIKHGIKASGMPAWAQGGIEDGAIWDLVAFINRLPELSKDDYKQLVASSDGHSHAGVADHHEDIGGHHEQGMKPTESHGDQMQAPSQEDHFDDGHSH